MPLERQEQFGDGQTGIGFGVSWNGSTIGEGIDGQTASRLADEPAVLDAAFLAPVGAEKVIASVDSDASLAALCVEQIAGNCVLLTWHRAVPFRFVEQFHDSNRFFHRTAERRQVT